MQFFLTDALINALVIPDDKDRVTVSDLGCPGLSLELRISGEGSWRYRYTVCKVQNCLTLGLFSELSLGQAREKYFEYRQLIESGEDPRRTMGSSSLKQCPTFETFVVSLYIPHIKSYKRCVSADETLLNNHLLPAFGQMKLNQVSHFSISQFVTEKLAAGYKPSYCNRFLVLLGFCFNLALKWDVPGVIKNPVKNIPLLKATNKIERFLKEDEFIKLSVAIHASPNPLLQYFVPLALLTGARKRELLDARWEDVDFQRGVWVIPFTKSGRPRHVPLVPEAIDLLQRLRRSLPSMMSQKPLLEIPWILPNPKTGKPFQSIFHSWDTARRQAGCPDLRIHDLRHSFASSLVNHGVPIYDVKELLGHRDIKTTERYAHLSPERLRGSASAVVKSYQGIGGQIEEGALVF